MNSAKIFLILIIFGLLVPGVIFAVNVGFVPSTQIWFSKDSFKAGEAVSAYSVIVNNGYASLKASIGFYANDKLIDTVSIANIRREQAEQIKVSWYPEAGEYNITARFLTAIGFDENGNPSIIDVEKINSEIGPFLVVSKNSNTKSADSGTTGLSEPKKIEPLRTQILPEGDHLRIITLSSPGQLSLTEGQKEIARLIDASNNAIHKIQETVGEVTSTAQNIRDTYDKTGKAISSGKEYFSTTNNKLSKLGQYLEKVKPVWNTITNNTDPVRVGFIIFLLILARYLFKWALRK